MKLTTFILIISVLINLLIILEGKKDGLEMYSIKDNLIRDSAVLNVPRILVGGGSCALFSVDTEKLEKSTNFACYNTAVFAGIGYNLVLENLLTVSKPNDKIILVPEYTIFA